MFLIDFGVVFNTLNRSNRTEGSLCHGLLGKRSWTAGASNRPQVTQSRLLDEVHLLFTFTMFIPKLIFRFISMLV